MTEQQPAAGWTATHTVKLAPPWEPMTITVWADPPMGDWLAMRDAASAAMSNPGDPVAADAALASFDPIIASHTVTDRQGKVLPQLRLALMPSGLLAAIVAGVLRAYVPEAAPPADPTPGRAPSPGRSSRRRPSRSASSSGASRS